MNNMPSRVDHKYIKKVLLDPEIHTLSLQFLLNIFNNSKSIPPKSTILKNQNLLPKKNHFIFLKYPIYPPINSKKNRCY